MSQYLGVFSQVLHAGSQVMTKADPRGASSILIDLASGFGTSQTGGSTLPVAHVTHLLDSSIQV